MVLARALPQESTLDKPEIPEREVQRLAALRALGILDTAPEERFDRLTRMARRLFDVPIALVSLVDQNRQWFKSCVGLDVRETDRDISFCGHAILGDSIFIIPDAARDARFADNPLVVEEPRIRFYAGCPLKFLDGSKLGTLCIIDQKPRQLDQDDLETLKDLAGMVERELAAVQLATLDELTNINNRRGFMLLAEHSLKLCERQKIPAVLVYFDLNQFKPINDRFGHAEGDRALTAFAEQVRSLSRDLDLLARVGGDEFVILLSNASIATAQHLVERVGRALEQYNRAAGRGYDLSFSHGIVEFDPDKHATLDALMADADALMYRSKKPRRVAGD
jgi:diguanylate cyclase (GGDEF)-like protein